MSSPTDRLATACANGDLPSAAAAIAGGASVNEEGCVPGWGKVPPLAAAVRYAHDAVVVWLLSHGADPNGDYVMDYGTFEGTAARLQLLIDAGGDVNGETVDGQPLVFFAVDSGIEDSVRVLLSEPSLDLLTSYEGRSPEEYALVYSGRAVADMIAHEVSECGAHFLPTSARLLSHRFGRWLWLPDHETGFVGTTHCKFHREGSMKPRIMCAFVVAAVLW